MPRPGRRYGRRDFLRLSGGAAAGIVLVGCTGSGTGVHGAVGGSGPTLLPPDDPFIELACGLARRWVRRIANGYHAERSAEIQILPKEPNFVGSGLPHTGPWDYTSRIPMFWYGPGFIRPLGVVDRRATSADISPTWARLAGVAFPTPNGRPLTDILVPERERRRPPRLILTVVWDGAGRDVLDEWPEAWPNLRSLIRDGAWIDAAEVGSSPTSSAQIHATIGTGSFPREHGVVGHRLRIGGKVVDPWSNGPDVLLRPTLADVYAEAAHGAISTGMLGTVPIQLGMLGHGAAWRDNEKALAVLRQPRNAETLGAEGPEWNLPEQFRRWYRFADYANRLPPLATYFPEADGRDGERDGRWRGHRIEDDVVEAGFQTPARIPYQTRLLEELIAREGFGRGDRPDLLYVNYKVIDMVGHIFSMNSYEMRDTLRTQDEYLRHLIDILDREVGSGSWAMLVTADHGSTPHPRVSGAFQISSSKLQVAIDETFGRDGPVVEQVKQTEIFVDREQLAKTSATLRDVSTFVMSLTQRDLASTGASASDPSARAFEAAFPSGIIPSLPCAATEVGAS